MTDPTRETEALRVVQEFLDSIAYAPVHLRYVGDSVFATFDTLQGIFERLSNPYKLLFSLLRQGHYCDLKEVAAVIPQPALEAFLSAGLLVIERDEVRTTGCIIVPVQGLYLIISIPPSFPTCTDRGQAVYLGVDTLRLLSALPRDMKGKCVLDVCSGSGVQGLMCAFRGASKVVCLEKSPTAARYAIQNATLNGLTGSVDVRISDLYSGLRPGELFDYVVCNPPFMPIAISPDFPAAGAGGIGGAELLDRIFADLSDWLHPSGQAAIYCECFGDQHHIFFNESMLRPFAAASRRPIRAFVLFKEPLPKLEGWVRGMSIQLRQAEGDHAAEAVGIDWRSAVQDVRPGAAFWYEQVIAIGAADTQAPDLQQLAVYEPILTDPLVVRLQGTTGLSGDTTQPIALEAGV